MSPINENDREKLVPFLDGELDEDEARDIEAKLVLDPSTRREADAYRQVWDLLDYLPKPQPSPNFTNRTMERLAIRPDVQTADLIKPARRGWLRAAAWAASVLIAVAGGYALSLYLWPAPRHVSQREIDQQLVRNLPVIENVHLLRNVDDLEFLENLNAPELFGEKDGV